MHHPPRGHKIYSFSQFFLVLFTVLIAFIQYEKFAGNTAAETDLWLAYCEFHRGNHKQALVLYELLDKV